MAKRYDKDFKHSMVRLVIDGKMTPSEVCCKYRLAKSCLYTWLQQWQQSATQEEAVSQTINSYHPRPVWTEFIMPEKRDVLATDSQAAGDIHLWSMETRIADLERLCGQLALENALLKKALATAQQRSVS